MNDSLKRKSTSFVNERDRCANGLGKNGLGPAPDDAVGAGGGGGGGIIWGGDEYSNAYDGRRPSRRLPSAREWNGISIQSLLIVLSFESCSLDWMYLPIAACNSVGELNCNFSHSYGYKYFMYLNENRKGKKWYHLLIIYDHWRNEW